MRLLEERILKDGKVYPGSVLKVDGFLNHQIDVGLLREIAKEFFNLYKDEGITKVLTIEASGIAIACMTAEEFGVPVLFAKKSKTNNISNDVYSSVVESYTHGTLNNIIVSKEYLHSDDKVLIVDDFLAQGNALKGLIELVKLAGAEVVGAGIVIEKAFQPGGDEIRATGVRVESLARVKSMTDDGKLCFCD
ncbi:MAG: xanthine phosphoribosyltransferase [Clostridia bacterium]|nr:xanthine phosphoribosyltransferase [Clostridia bacterium]